jgi:hypothetical protein
MIERMLKIENQLWLTKHVLFILNAIKRSVPSLVFPFLYSIEAKAYFLISYDLKKCLKSGKFIHLKFVE